MSYSKIQTLSMKWQLRRHIFSTLRFDAFDIALLPYKTLLLQTYNFYSERTAADAHRLPE
jgi:hypothetical protein